MKPVKIVYIHKNVKNYTISKIKREIFINYNIFLIIKSLIIPIFFLAKKYFEIKVNYYKKQNEIYEINNTIANYTLENTIIYTSQVFYQNKKEFNNNDSNFEYFCCFCTMGKMENLYIRELLSYYTSIGVDKFVLADNNLPNTEKFSDVIQDYIKNNTVDIIDIIGKSYKDGALYAIIYEKYKNKCKWLTFFDFDEYLRIHSEDGKIIGLNKYLSNKIFEKCEAVVVNWLMYDDNNLVYYDNRTTLERFPNPLYNHGANGYVKSIVRGHLNKTVFRANRSHHCPYKEVKTCDSMGNIRNNLKDAINPPLFKYAYLMHFNTRTAEEFIRKIKRGYPGNVYHPYLQKLESFFNKNKFTEEKLKLFERSFNQSFDIIRRKYKNKK